MAVAIIQESMRDHHSVESKSNEQAGENLAPADRLRAAMIRYIHSPEDAAAAFPDLIGDLRTHRPEDAASERETDSREIRGHNGP